MTKFKELMALHTAAKNKKFNDASRTQRRIMICEDVIKYLDTPAIRISPGTYYDGDARKHSKPIDSLIDGTASCRVCARGAMMISRFRFDKEADSLDLDLLDSDQNCTVQTLSDDFTKEELLLIESIFERDSDFIWGGNEYQSSTGAYKDKYLFYKDLIEFRKVLKTFSLSPKTRLRQIMERIISCNGDVEKALTCKEDEKPKTETYKGEKQGVQ